MALSVVQAKKIGNAGGASVTVNSAITVSAGNLMVVGGVAFAGNAAVMAASDNVNGSYTHIAESALASGLEHSAILYKGNISAGTLNLTASDTGAGAIEASFHEVSGADTTAPFTTGEQTTGTGAASTNPQTGSVTNAVPNSVFFAVISNSAGNNPTTMTVNSTGSSPTGWALRDSTNSQELNGAATLCFSVPFLIVSASAATKHGWTTGNFDFAYAIACFIQAASGGGGGGAAPPNRRLLMGVG